MIIKLYNELSSVCFGRSHVLGFQAIFIFFHCFPVPCTCSADPPLATAGVWTVQEVQFFSVIGDGSIVPAAESALQRFIHAFSCCPARGRERGEWVTHPSAHWLVLWKCVRNDLSHLGLSLLISYIQANAQMLVQSARERVCSFKATAWEGRDPETHAQHTLTHINVWHSQVPTDSNVWHAHAYGVYGVDSYTQTCTNILYWVKVHQMERDIWNPNYIQAKNKKCPLGNN